MAKKKGLAIPDCSPSKINTHKIAAGTALHRVHPDLYSGVEFNPWEHSDARFSTIRDSAGTVIPVIYVAETFDAALMETVFHDIPYQQDDKFLDKSKLDGLVHTEVVTTQEILVADLTTKGLRKLGVNPVDLVTSEKDHYPFSRAVAESIIQNNPSIQGLRWMSRQDNTAEAYVLFEPRFSSAPLDQTAPPRGLDTEAYDDVLDLAEVIDVQIIPGKVA